MGYDFKPIDDLTSAVVGTTNFIARILFNKTTFIAAAFLSFVVFALVLVS